MSRKRNGDKSMELPSSAKPKKEITFRVERKILIQVIILIILSLIILGCAAGKETKQVICRNSFYAVNGWVSAENSQSYWVVDSQGKTMEFSKNNCSIKG